MLLPRPHILVLLFSLYLAHLASQRELPSVHGSANAAEVAAFRVIDEFEGKLSLDWKPLRPAPTHFSLTKRPGKLVVTTQAGSMNRQSRPDTKPLTKNVFLVDNPSSEGPGFVSTTRLDTFHPTTHWQQAGLLLFDDEDNYLKFVLEYNTRHGGRIWNLFREVNAESKAATIEVAHDRCPSVWLRVTTRGAFHEFATSTDGETFTAHGELPWGDGSPAKIGLLATNGSNRAADEIDACFDFFEVRSLTAEEMNEPHYVERQKLKGSWKVVSSETDGKLDDVALSRVVFTGAKVTVEEGEQSLDIEYALDLSKKDKQLLLSSFIGQRGRQVKGIYAIENAGLTICLSLRPGSDAPSEFETEAGDGRMLLRLKRTDSPPRLP